MALDPDIKDRFDEMSQHIKDLSMEIVSTRHALKGSMDTIANQLVENTINVKMHSRHLEKLDDIIASNSREHNERLRSVELVALRMDQIPERVDQLERQTESIGKFTWGDVWKLTGSLSAACLVLVSIAGLFHYGAG